MRIREFVEDSLDRTGDGIRPSTREEYLAAMEDYISVIVQITEFRLLIDRVTS